MTRAQRVYTRVVILAAHGYTDGPIPAHVEAALAAAGVPTRHSVYPPPLTAYEKQRRRDAPQGR